MWRVRASVWVCVGGVIVPEEDLFSMGAAHRRQGEAKDVVDYNYGDRGVEQSCRVPHLGVPDAKAFSALAHNSFRERAEQVLNAVELPKVPEVEEHKSSIGRPHEKRYQGTNEYVSVLR